MAALLQELQALGSTDGRNMRIDIRWAASDADRYRQYASELVELAPDVILAISPVVVEALQRQIDRAKNGAGMNERNLRFHDLRGTAATKFYIAGLSTRVIAEILAWNEEQVERIIRRYVARAAATRAAIRQLNEARKRT